jgi:rhodanese-related sulfurtransferase
MAAVAVTATGLLAASLQLGSGGDAVTIDSFKAVVAESPDTIHIIDVRDPAEFEQGHIAGAVNLSIDDLEDKVDELPSDKPIVFVCSTGARSGEAYDIVKLLREDLEVYFVNAEITYNPDGTQTYVPLEG